MRRIVYENELFAATPTEVAHLRLVLGNDLEVTPNGARIVRVAGHIRLPDGAVFSIRSRKATGASLLAWLAYGDPHLRALRTLGAVPDNADDADFGPFVARMFCYETWRALQSSGLLRAYQRGLVRSSTIRGRIDFGALSRSGGDVARTPCHVFSRLPHTPLNGLLAAATERIRRDVLMREAAGPLLPPLWSLLAEVPAYVDRDLLAGRRTLSRLEQPFQASAALAALVLRDAGLGEGTRLGSPAFLLRLADLFESTIARAFGDSRFRSIPKQALTVQRIDESRLSRHTPMEIDVFLPDVDGEPVVVDAKFRSTVSAGSLQQMVAYCWMTGSRRAVLVCPKGRVADRRGYLLPAADGAEKVIRVDVVEMSLSSTTLEGWRAAAAGAVESVRAAACPQD